MRRLLGLLLLAVMPLAACSDDDGSGPEATIEGAYTLRTVNGQPLPYVLLQVASVKFEILSSAVTIAQGGTFTHSAAVRYTDETGATTDEQTITGTFVRSGNNITLTQSGEDPATLSGVWNGDNRLTMTETDTDFGTLVYVYQK